MLCLSALAPASAQDGDGAPLAERNEPAPADPCAPIRRVSHEFGAAFSGFAVADTERTYAIPGTGGEGPPLQVSVAANPPWQPPAAGLMPPARPFLASKLLPTERTGFDREWRRVRDITLGSQCAAMLLGAALPRGLSRQSVEAVNRWANRNIRYVDDVRGDRWADAAQTLREHKGDCEDLAILKMQLLAALGIPTGAMYLSLVRDRIRRRDHAVLVVRLGPTAWILDDASDRLLDGTGANDYQPVMSFSEGRKWLHGR